MKHLNVIEQQTNDLHRKSLLFLQADYSNDLVTKLYKK